jgi:hypothetical protein
VLLVTKNTIPSVIATELTRLEPNKIVVLGGTNTISDTVEAALGAYAIMVTRIADRRARRNEHGLGRRLLAAGRASGDVARRFPAGRARSVRRSSPHPSRSPQRVEARR